MDTLREMHGVYTVSNHNDFHMILATTDSPILQSSHKKGSELDERGEPNLEVRIAVFESPVEGCLPYDKHR
jgi:hypothetical protein